MKTPDYVGHPVHLYACVDAPLVRAENAAVWFYYRNNGSNLKNRKVLRVLYHHYKWCLGIQESTKTDSNAPSRKARYEAGFWLDNLDVVYPGASREFLRYYFGG